MSEKEFVEKLLQYFWVEVEEDRIDNFLTEFHKEYYEIEFVNISEAEKENEEMMREQESNYNRDIAASIERQSWK